MTEESRAFCPDSGWVEEGKLRKKKMGVERAQLARLAEIRVPGSNWSLS